MRYFRNFPEIQYKFGNKEVYSKDVFLRFSFLEYIKDKDFVFEPYLIQEGDRPDIVAEKVYGNANLHWVVMFVNGTVDPLDWLASSRTMTEYVKERYVNPYATAYQLKNGQVVNNQAEQIAVTKNPFNTVDSDPDATVYTTENVSYFDLEGLKNDEKRIITILKPAYLAAFLKDVEGRIKAAQ